MKCIKDFVISLQFQDCGHPFQKCDCCCFDIIVNQNEWVYQKGYKGDRSNN